MSEHFKIQNAIFAKHNINLPLFPLDPIPMDSLHNLLNWSRNHQAMHAGPLGILGLPVRDLTNVDFTKPEQVIEWTLDHGNDHVLLAQALGLT
jgi:hypothetical protein